MKSSRSTMRLRSSSQHKQDPHLLFDEELKVGDALEVLLAAQASGPPLDPLWTPFGPPYDPHSRTPTCCLMKSSRSAMRLRSSSQHKQVDPL
eukprot:1173036-Prorocentrum_minimum.AAC.1